MNSKNRSIIALSLVVIAAFSVLFNHGDSDPAPSTNSGAEASQARKSDRKSEVTSAESKEARVARLAREDLVRDVKEKQLAFWSQNASAGFDLSLKTLLADLNLSAEETTGVKEIFARREAELAGLLAEMHAGEAADDMELLRQICALLRNKGLREDLAGVLSVRNLASFDANEANRERETIEARAYRDMADINAVVLLTEAQKQQALAALMKSAPARVEKEADTRAFMTLNYGQMLTDVDSSSIRGLANMVSAGLNDEVPAVEIDSSHYQQWTQANKAERIGHELSILQPILDEDQITRYREHLEAEPAW
jgi:hypothetical protein